MLLWMLVKAYVKMVLIGSNCLSQLLQNWQSSDLQKSPFKPVTYLTIAFSSSMQLHCYGCRFACVAKLCYGTANIFHLCWSVWANCWIKPIWMDERKLRNPVSCFIVDIVQQLFNNIYVDYLQENKWEHFFLFCCLTHIQLCTQVTAASDMQIWFPLLCLHSIVVLNLAVGTLG